MDHSEKKSGPYFRQTLLHLPSSPDGALNDTDDQTSYSDPRDTDPINRINYLLTKKSAASASTLVIPIQTDAGPTDAKEHDSSSIDEQIAAGAFLSISCVNETLRQQHPITLLPDSMEEPVEAIEDTIPTQSSPEMSTSSSLPLSKRVLYVAQGEIAHCVATQADILVSDRATTCHILALRSSGGHPDNELVATALCTIAHLDRTSYSQCIRDAFQTHYEFHARSGNDLAIPYIELDIHVVGGFKDTSGDSRKTTSWILNLLADLADVYYTKKPAMKMVLRTACVTAANHNHETGGPVVRGLALDCDSGEVYAARAKHPGPEMKLRMARLWLCGHSLNTCDVSKLRIIHTYHIDMVIIEPLFVRESRFCRCGFLQYQMQAYFQQLLGIRDDKILLKCCSTSPEHEEDDFCDSTRNSFSYALMQYTSVPTTDLSSTTVPLRFRRIGGSNRWVQIREM